jgi:hypothetical protein
MDRHPQGSGPPRVLEERVPARYTLPDAIRTGGSGGARSADHAALAAWLESLGESASEELAIHYLEGKCIEAGLVHARAAMPHVNLWQEGDLARWICRKALSILPVFSPSRGEIEESLATVLKKAVNHAEAEAALHRVFRPLLRAKGRAARLRRSVL